MAELGRFFDGGGDYGAQDFAQFFSNFLETGYFSGLKVTANDTMEVSVSIGSAFLEGYEYRNTSALNKTVDTANATNDRIDRLVVRLDKSPDATNPVETLIRLGTASTTPVAPTLIRDTSIYEISLAQILVTAGKSFIDSTQITDERENLDVCGPALPNGTLKKDDALTETSTLEGYDFGVSVMRINNWQGMEYGVVTTIRAIQTTGFQILKNTGSPTSRMLVRHTSLGVWQGWVNMVSEEGSNTNGSYRKSGNKTLECWHKGTATFVSASSLEFNWTFPAEFVDSNIVITPNRGNATATNLSNSQILNGYPTPNTKSGVTIIINRIQGMSDFVSGDTATVHLLARGKHA
ncbi:hypothetical protein [Salipaludibacillus sp. CF4.18]|uniref:hypothetical protein n=1 Tax=Salipaludibacillus sp. CF4.18 TaxID=3373081 RepID=UPI003EE81B1B